VAGLVSLAVASQMLHWQSRLLVLPLLGKIALDSCFFPSVLAWKLGANLRQSRHAILVFAPAWSPCLLVVAREVSLLQHPSVLCLLERIRWDPNHSDLALNLIAPDQRGQLLL
jgi:hypothetical protein